MNNNSCNIINNNKLKVYLLLVALEKLTVAVDQNNLKEGEERER